MIELVNGYPCKDCTDVELAKKNIDPASGRNERDIAATQKAEDSRAREQAFVLDGALAKAATQSADESAGTAERADESRRVARADDRPDIRPSASLDIQV